ncbi:alkaline phosphatase D family protein [Parendozoicomonas sp. Alg238-R29]|uniref:alkaline phosphatase D family protein n=1 Tax=Parendozoicomonas sp. Alg238-R29 TaxID=2993446 RepID=UPI00248EFFC9|nr:alkaline phosphatase D family protein [Parendozoicomonas sp. Alg238-R29]
MTITRRRFFQGAALGIAALPLLKSYASAHQPFRHGIASGDPLADRVILWTRVTPDQDPLFASAIVPYEWQVALDPGMASIVHTGSGVTGPEVDYTVKVDADNLVPGTTYYYRFLSNGVESPIGRTKTLPVGHLNRMRLAFCSCSNYPAGYFNVYKEIARRPELDVVLHLGDYIYEYGPGGFGTGKDLGRDPLPAKEITALQDYRLRYAQYRTDPDLQEVHRQHPFICIWDDHESANDAWKGGADNHDDGEGRWEDRRTAAIQTYFDWMPIRETGIVDQFGSQSIYRNFRFGNLMDLFMLDTRLFGRDKQARPLDARTAKDTSRTLLGEQQEQWLHNGLSQSQRDGVRWRVLGQQVMMSQLTINPDLPINMDQWDGYQGSRDRLFDHITGQGIDNLMVLTGDIHTSWAFDLAEDPHRISRYSRFSGRGAIGGEFVTPGVTSGLGDKSGLTEAAGLAVDGILRNLKWANISERGYVLLDISHSRSKAHWYHVDTVKSPHYSAYLARMYKQKAGDNHIHRAWRESSASDYDPPAPAMYSALGSLRSRFMV